MPDGHLDLQHTGAGIRALFEERYTKQELEQLADLLARLPGVGDAEGADCVTE